MVYMFSRLSLLKKGFITGVDLNIHFKNNI